MNLYDVGIIGAGITGAGIAQAAAARGWSTLLLERESAPGLGTSSNSSKLIHGGLRYLETGQIPLVYECLREREILLRNAPDLVTLKPFYLPVYDNSSRSAGWIRIGLSLYSLLNGLQKSSRFDSLPSSQWPSLPIKQDGLKAVFRYWDAQTQDRILTQRVVASAQSLGAQIITSCPITVIEQASQCYRLISSDQIFHCRHLINAAGPWVKDVAGLCPQLPQLPIRWAQGIHLLLDIPAFEQCFYVEAPQDKRAVFMLPWQGKTLIGTTETLVTSPNNSTPYPAEIEYLLAVVNHYLPHHPVTSAHILQTMCGLRVLADTPNGSINRQPRDTQILRTPEALAYTAVYGGKLTSYRATAEKVAKLLSKSLPQHPSVDVRRLSL